MTTVKSPGESFPDNHDTTTVSDPKSHDYGRAAAGGNAMDSGNPVAMPSVSDAPAGSIPGYEVNWSGADVSTGGTQTASEVFDGSTLIVPQPDATGHPASDGVASGNLPGTVGDSGDQRVGPGPVPPVTGMPDIDNDGDAV